MKLGSMLLVMVVAAGAPVGAQSLGETAQKEKEKREAKAKEASAKTSKPGAKAPEAKVYTGEDLAGYAEKQAAPAGSGDAVEGAPPPPTGESTPRVQRPSGEPGSGGSDDSAERARQERSWRHRAESARAAVAAAERELAAAEKAKARLGIGPQVNDRELLRYFSSQVHEAELRVTRAQGALAVAKTDLTNLEEEARREGALPGWLR